MYLFTNKLKVPARWVFYTTAILACLYYFVFNEKWDFEFFEISVPTLSDDFFFENDGNRYLTTTNIMDEILSVILILSGFAFGFSKWKMEDELIAKIRMDALAWSMFINYGIFLLCILGFHGLTFFKVMTIQMFSILILFNLRQEYGIWLHLKKNDSDEE